GRAQLRVRGFVWLLPTVPGAFGCNRSPRISGGYLASSGVQFPVQQERHCNRDRRYKGEMLVRGVLRRRLGGCEMRSGGLLPLPPTAREYDRQRSKAGHEPRRGGNRL